MADVGSARVEVTGDVRQFARQTEKELRAVLSGMRSPEIKIDVDRNNLVSAFNKAGTEAAATMTTSVGKGLSGLGSSLTSNPYVLAAGALLGTTLAGALLPALGAALSSAVIGGGALAALAGGIALVADRPEIKKAAKSIKDRFLDIDTSDLEVQIEAARERLDKARKSRNKAAIADARKDLATLETELSKAQAFNAKNFSLRDAAAPLIKPVVAALQTLVTEAKPIIASLGQMFTTLAESGVIQSLTEGLLGLVKAALPGFQQLIVAAGPFLKVLAEQLPLIGFALGQFFSSIAAQGPEAAVFFRDLGVFVAGAIIALGQFIGWLTQVYPQVRAFFIGVHDGVVAAIEMFRQFGSGVAAAFAPLVPIISGVWSIIVAVVTTAWNVISAVVRTGINIVRGTIAAVSAAVRGDWQGTWNGIKSIVTSVLNGIRSVVSSVLNGIRSTTVGAINTIRSAWSAGWNGLVSATVSAVSRVRSIVIGLRSTVTGAFAAAGSWLASAGRRIIDGLISGIQAGFGRVRSILSSLTSMLPDWKGPPAVDQMILYKAGQLTMAGYEKGLQSQFGSIRDTLSGLTADIPSFSGAARGGDGSSAGSRSFTIMPGAIVINGGGSGAGQEAAEQLLEALANAQS